MKYYIPKEKDIETDLVYIYVNDNNELYYVYSNGKDIKSKYGSDSSEKYLKYYYREIPNYELALLV